MINILYTAFSRCFPSVTFSSNVQRNKTLAINILMKYSTETLTTMSDKVSKLNEGNIGES